MVNFKIIGLDLSLRETGVCILSGKDGGQEKCALTTLKNDLRYLERLDWLGGRMNELFDTEAPDYVVIEGYAMGIRGSRVFSCGEWGGMVRMICYRRKLPFLIVPPTTLKKYATGKGNAVKGQVMAAVERRWGLTIKNDNMADAYVLARIGFDFLSPDAHPELKQLALNEENQYCLRTRENKTEE